MRWRVEDATRALHAAHDFDRDCCGELVGRDEIDLGVDDLARFDAFEPGVPRENFFGECHAHDKSIIGRRRGRDLRNAARTTTSVSRRAPSTPGGVPDPATGSRAVPIYQTTAFVFGSTEQAAELFALRSYGHIYSRISNPTVAAFEERMASLEGGLGAIAFASGLAAQLATVLTVAQAGDHLVCTQNVYGGTVTQLSVTVKRMGIDTTFVPADDLDAVRAAITPGNEVALRRDGRQPVGRGRRSARPLQTSRTMLGVPLVVDNTFATPYLCRPIDFGADVVLHSATKFINGHGTAIGGVLVESGKFPWGNGRFPLLSTPSPGYHGKVFTETFGEYAFLMRARAEVSRDVGAAMAPMEAWLMLRRSRNARASNAASRAQRARRRRFLARSRRRSRGSANRRSVRSSPSACTAGATPRDASSMRSSSGATWPTSATPRAWSSLRLRRHTRSSPTRSCAKRASSPRACGSRSDSKRSTICCGISRTACAPRNDANDAFGDVASCWGRQRTIAMVGASSNPLRPSYTVFSYSADADAVRGDADQSDALRDRRRARLSVAGGLRAGSAASPISSTSSVGRANWWRSCERRSPSRLPRFGSNTASSTTRRSRSPTEPA